MEVMVLHTEIPQGSTCAEQKVGGGEITQEDLKRDSRNKHCFTCAGRSPNSGYNQKEFPIQGSAMLGIWTDMRGHGKFKDWRTMEKIDRLCSGLARQPMEDTKFMSKMGAVRMSKNEVMELLGAHSSTEGYHVRM
eukprot:13831793-Heterocapsa_arctica.AAC.1